MILRRLSAVLLLAGAGVVPALAQDAAILSPDGSFEPIPPVFLVTQDDDVNVAGIAQTSDLANSSVTQNGFYNRAAIVQTGADTFGLVNQTGEFNRALILQEDPAFIDNNADGVADLNAAVIGQFGGEFNTLFIIQTGLDNSAFAIQDGGNNEALFIQDDALDFDLSPDDIQNLVTNFIFAPETIRATAEGAELDGVAFVDAILARGTARGPFCAPAAPVGLKDTPAPLDCGTVNVFTSFDYSGGEQEDRLGSLGFDHDTAAVMLGAEMAFTDKFLGGLALRYARTDLDVLDGVADVEIESLGGTVFGEYRDAGLFVTGMGFYSDNDAEVERPGIGGATRADPEGETYGGAVRAGYLFALGDGVEAGPIAGYTHVSSEFDAYEERGNALLVQTELFDTEGESRLGLIGARIAFAHDRSDVRLSGFFDLAYERDFGDDEDFEIQRTEFEFAPGVGVFTPVDEIGDIDYLHLAGTATAAFSNGVSVDVSAGGRFGDERDAYRLGAELRKGF